MSRHSVGERIGALIGAKDKTVKFLGYGIYQGEEVPPKDAGGFNFGYPNPKLLLDNGKVVWGCECWWGSEDQIKARVKQWESDGYSIVEVDIDKERAAAA